MRKEERRGPKTWPKGTNRDKVLCKKAAGFFIYASTVVKFVASKYDLPPMRLSIITLLPSSTIEEGRSGLDQLYIKVLEEAFCDTCTDNSQLYSHF